MANDPNYVYLPILNLIGKAEGTDRGRKYNETLAYGAYIGGDVNLVGMSLRDIDDLQTNMLNHPMNKWNSSAIGRYQIVRTTLRKIKAAMNMKEDRLFDESTQDQMARYLLYYRGIDNYCKGKITAGAMVNSLAKEWASFPTVDGTGHYGNQKNTPITVAQVKSALYKVKGRYNSNPEETIINAPTKTPVDIVVEYDPPVETPKKTWVDVVFAIFKLFSKK